jgi:transcription antitermination factor NusG
VSHNPESALPPSYLEPRWYAANTRSRHEKSVAEQLGRKNVEFFLPLYQSERRWSDRKMRIDLPVFPGYIFVQIPLRERLRVLEVPGVVKFVSFGADPVPMDATEIEILRQGLTSKLKAEPHPYLKIGQRVLVKHGPMAGLEGILVQKRNAFRVVISVDLIMRSVALEIPVSDLQIL